MNEYHRLLFQVHLDVSLIQKQNSYSESIIRSTVSTLNLNTKTLRPASKLKPIGLPK